MLSQNDVKILAQVAILYKNNLLKKNVMFIHYNRKTKKYSSTEMLFDKSHFFI